MNIIEDYSKKSINTTTPELQFFLSGYDTSKKLARIGIPKLKSMIVDGNFKSLPDPQKTPLWIYLAGLMKVYRIHKLQKGVALKVKVNNRESESPISSSRRSDDSHKKGIVLKNSLPQTSIEKLNRLIKIVEPRPDPRIYEMNWLNIGKSKDGDSSYQSMQKILRDQKYIAKEYKKITSKLRTLSYDGLVTLFKDENFNDIEKHIKINLSECPRKRDKIDMACSLVLGNLRKLNLDRNKQQNQKTQSGSFNGSIKSIASSKQGDSSNRKKNISFAPLRASILNRVNTRKYDYEAKRSQILELIN